MSSILEALERAEAERHKGNGSASRRPPAANRPRRWAGPLLVLLILLLNLGLWLFYRQAPTEETVSPSAAQPVKPVPAALAPASVDEKPARAPSEPGPALSAGEQLRQPPRPRAGHGTPASAAPASIEEKAEAADSTPGPSLSLGEQLKRHTAPSNRPLVSEAVVTRPPPIRSSATKAQAVSAGVESPPETLPSLATAPASSVLPVERSIEPAAPPEPSAVAATGESEPLLNTLSPPPQQSATATPPEQASAAMQEQIPLVWELPQQLREKILQLKSSVHVYSKTPGQRFVIINMHRYGEGDSLPPDGFLLKRIDRDGVIIDYGDGLVRLQQR